MATFQTVIDDARVTLNDVDGTRYTAPQLMQFCNDGIQEIFRIRPDFLLGQYTAADVTYVESDPIPIPLKFQNLLGFYVVFRAELRDDEYSAESRAGAMRQLFKSELT
jgi:hypothetical protein